MTSVFLLVIVESGFVIAIEGEPIQSRSVLIDVGTVGAIGSKSAVACAVIVSWGD